MKMIFTSRISAGERFFTTLNTILLILVGVITLAPLTHVLSISLMSREAVAESRMIFLPNIFELDFSGYKFILSGTFKIFMTCLKNSFYVTAVGTVLEVILIILTAYPLSRKQLKYKSAIMFFVFFPMIFTPGIIPSYIIVQKTLLMGRLESLIIPMLVSGFNVLLAINFFKTLPESMEESAVIDGAGHLTIAFKIILPLSKPIMATLVVFTSVQLWNNFFSALMYIQSTSKYTLQLFLYQLVAQAGAKMTVLAHGGTYKPPSEQDIMAAIILTTIPITLIYPFVQRFFIGGIMVGAVKE